MLQVQERARHAALVLNLLAGQALLGTGQLTDAGRIFVRLAQRVSEGEVSFGSEAVGMPATSIRQQAIRWECRARSSVKVTSSPKRQLFVVQQHGCYNGV